MTTVTRTIHIDMAKVTKETADKAVLDIAKAGAGMAVKLSPTDMGELKRSITAEPVEHGVALYGSNVDYAPWVEFGSNPHTAPISALEGWAKRHGVPVGAVWMSIRKNGTKPHRMFTKSADQLRKKASGIYAKILKQGLYNGK